MADDPSNEDSWLYGDSNPEPPEDEGKDKEPADKDEKDVPQNEESEEKLEEVTEDTPVTEQIDGKDTPTDEAMEEANATNGGTAEDGETGEPAEAGDQDEEKKDEKGEKEDDDDDDDDDSDDDIQVTIGDIKTSTTYASSMNMKRGPADKAKQPQQGKFSIEEFEAVGTINGVPAHEFNLDTMEDKPWRMPGADITDYFNYGFNEDTWRAYCEKQKRLRITESGVGLAGIGAGAPNNSGSVVKTLTGTIPVSIVNENSKYASSLALKRAGPPPGRKPQGAIDVIGGEREGGAITVMGGGGGGGGGGGERGDYGGHGGAPYPNMNVPPPGFGGPPSFGPPPGNFGGAPEYFPTEADPYYNNYEPTQDLQWSNQPPRWEGRTSAPATTNVVIPVGGQDEASIQSKDSGGEKEEEKTERRSSRHKHRSRSRSTERSTRSSKKRNKSRSRSPSHRHRSKKKSRRSERDDE